MSLPILHSVKQNSFLVERELGSIRVLHLGSLSLELCTTVEVYLVSAQLAGTLFHSSEALQYVAYCLVL
jgi:hypothetical protein